MNLRTINYCSDSHLKTPRSRDDSLSSPSLLSLFTRVTVIVIVLVLALPIIFPHQAQLNAAEITLQLSTNELEKARKKYQTAQALLSQGKRSSYEALKKELVHYPLYPYLLYAEYRRYLTTTSEIKIADFIQQYADMPLSPRLNRHWLRHLRKKGEWSKYLSNFSSTSSADLNCYYHWAQYKSGDKQAAFSGAKSLWIIGDAQHSACDSLFKAWLKSTSFNSDYAWQRIGLAIKKGKPDLVRYLTRYLDLQSAKLAHLWLSIRSKPSLLATNTKLINTKLIPAGDKEQEIILYGIKRLLPRDSELALSSLSSYETVVSFNSDALLETHTHIARYLANRDMSNSDYWLRLSHDSNNNEYLIRKIRYALKQQDWNRVYHYLNLLPQEQQQESKWQYWRARTLVALEHATARELLLRDTVSNSSAITGPTNSINISKPFIDMLLTAEQHPNVTRQHHYPSSKEAQEIYHRLAPQRDIYGFLSSEKLAKELSLNFVQRELSQVERLKIASRPGIQRAKEFYTLGDKRAARSEWYYATKNLSLRERTNAAKLAQNWGWDSQAIITAARSDGRDDIELRFPTPFADIVSEQAASNNIDNDWVFSLMRQESAFMSDVESSAGALGVMQIMPATGREIAKRNGLPFKSKKVLLQPKSNIQMGTLYLAQLMERFDNNLLMATAAYNAGPNRVKRWRPKHETMPGDIWMETIPFKETRNYVKNIVAYQAIYRFHLGKEIQLTDSLAGISPRIKVKPTPNTETASAASSMQQYMTISSLGPVERDHLPRPSDATSKR